MGALEVLDGRAARRWALTALGAMGQARAEIDALNVYPVPDGDTGTNLYLTLEQAVESVEATGSDLPLGEVAEAFARGALLGARGNSGVITSQMLRGWADVLAGRDVADGPVVRVALERAAEQAYAAVARPAEGTMLTVAASAAGAARAAGDSLGQVVTAAAQAAREALQRTPEQLEVLRRAGVVDAGGRGLVVLLDALEAVVTGTRHLRPGRLGARVPHLPDCTDLALDGPAYEVMYLLDADDDAVATLRRTLDGLGDSLVVVGGGGLWNVHVHTDDVGAAIEAGIEAGRPHRLVVTHFADQLRAQAAEREEAATRRPTAVVAAVSGPGAAALFRAAGAVVVGAKVARRASTGELLEAVRAAQADGVVLLPNDPDTRAVAEAAAAGARSEGIKVAVVPTRSVVQGLAAVAVHDPSRPLPEDLVEMSAAAAATRHGAVTVATREAITSAGRCQVGDVLGLVDGDVVVVGDDLADVAAEVALRLLGGGGELMTLLTGADAPADLPDVVRRRVRALRHDVEVAVHDGGQPGYPLLVGVE